MLDEITGKPYLLCYKGVHSSVKTEKSLDSDGNEIITRSEVIGDPILSKNFNLAPEWQTKRKWSEIKKKRVMKIVEGSMDLDNVSLEPKDAIMLVEYMVDASKCHYLYNGDERDVVFLKETPSGLFARNFASDITQLFPPNKTLLAHHVYQIISEREISVSSAKDLLRKGIYCGDLGLRLSLGFSAAL